MILARYIGSTLIKAMLLVLLVFIGLELFILLATQLNSLGKGSYHIGQAFLYVLLILPQQTYVLFPVAGLLGMLFGLSILANHSELIIMRAAGLSPWQIMRYALVFGGLLIIIMTLIGEGVGPWAKHLAEKQKLKATTSGRALKTAQGLWLRQEQNFYYIQNIYSPKHIENISHYSFNTHQQLESVSFAKEGYFKNHEWHIQAIQKSIIHLDLKKITTQHIPNTIWDLAIDPRLLSISSSTPNEMSLSQLSDYIDYQKRSHLVPLIYQLSFWQRVMQPLASLVMMFLAIPFIFGFLRSTTTSLRLLLGIIVGFVFYMCNQLFPPLSQVLNFPPYFAAFLPSLLFMFLGILLSFLYLVRWG